MRGIHSNFRFFTQSDVEVNDNYMERYSQVFKPTEVNDDVGLFKYRNSSTLLPTPFVRKLDA